MNASAGTSGDGTAMNRRGIPFIAPKTFTEPGTGKWSSAKEVTNARVGKGYWMSHDKYCVDGALMFLEEHFVNEAYDRPGNRPLLLRG